MRELIFVWLYTLWGLVVIIGALSIVHLLAPGLVKLDEGQQLWHIWATFGAVWLSLPILAAILLLPLRILR